MNRVICSYLALALLIYPTSTHGQEKGEYFPKGYVTGKKTKDAKDVQKSPATPLPKKKLAAEENGKRPVISTSNGEKSPGVAPSTPDKGDGSAAPSIGTDINAVIDDKDLSELESRPENGSPVDKVVPPEVSIAPTISIEERIRSAVKKGEAAVSAQSGKKGGLQGKAGKQEVLKKENLPTPPDEVKSNSKYVRDGNSPLETHPVIKKIGAVINCSYNAHCLTVLEEMSAVAQRLNFQIGDIFVIGRGDKILTNIDLMRLVARGAVIHVAFGLPRQFLRLTIKKSPVWILNTEEGEVLVEGDYSLSNYIDVQKRFVDPG